MSKQDNTDKARRLARAVIALDEPWQINGQAPDDDEVRLWVAGQLSARRAEQLTLYALQDPQLMHRFRELKTESRKRGLLPAACAFKDKLEDIAYELVDGARACLKNLTFANGFNRHVASGLVAVSLVVGFFTFQGEHLLSSPRDAWQSDAVIKSNFTNTDVAELSGEHIGLLLGIDDIQPDIANIEVLQLDTQLNIACSEADWQCHERLASMRSIGQLAATTDQSCRAGTQTEVNTGATTQIQNTMNTLAGQLSAQRFVQPLQRWRDSTTAQRFCASAADLIERATRNVR